MAVLNNTGILAGSSAVTDGGDAYQISRSLRFNDDDDAYLSKHIAVDSNRLQWTWAAWVKRSKVGSGGFDLASAWADDNWRTVIRFGDDFLEFSQKIDGADGGGGDTDEVYRDPTAWMHICVVQKNNTNNPSSDRQRVFINGRLATLSGVLSASLKGMINKSGTWRIGSFRGTDNHFAGYLADVNFLDGVDLGAACFGKFNSSGIWIPTAINFPAINNGTTWSGSGFSGDSIDSSYPATHLFDGLVGNNQNYGTQFYSANQAATIHWEPSGGIKYNQGIRVNLSYNGTCSVNDGEHIVDTDGSGGLEWQTIVEGSGTLNKLTFKSLGTHKVYMEGIEIDGQVLIDGKTDSTWEAWKARNDSTDLWSNHVTGTLYSSEVLKTTMFDGAWRNGTTFPSEGNTLQFKPPTTITASSQIRVYMFINGSADTHTDNFKVNGTSQFNAALSAIGGGNTDWYTLSGTTIDSTNGLQWKRTSGSSQVQICAIEVDGVLLTDSMNSFSLKFNDTALDRYLGKDTLHGKLEDATGGKPLLKTTDDYGFTLGSGNATDSFSSDLKFAFAGNNATGSSLDISGSGHSCTVTNATLVTDQSQFYGSSINFGGDAKITTPTHSDFDLGTTNWTVEFWSRPSESSSQSALVSMGDDGSSSNGILIGYQSSGNLFCYGSNTSAWNLFSGKSLGAERVGSWSHYAITRQGSTFRFFNNGVLTDTASHSGDVAQNVNAFTIGVGQTGAVGANGYIHGNIQDFRYYNHGSDAPKYTSEFTVPYRNDWQIHNLTAATDLVTVYGSTMLSDGATARFYDPDSNDAYGVASRFNMFDGSLSTRCGNPDSTNVFSWDTSSYSFSGLLEVYGANTSGHTNNIFVNDVDSGVDLPGTAGWTTVGTYNSGINKVHFSAAGGINIYAFRVAGTIITDTLEDAPKVIDVDSFTDTPTSYGDDTGVGAELRGNYCTWNAADNPQGLGLSQGNLAVKKGSASGMVLGTLAMPAGGKFYWEVEIQSESGTAGECYAGIANRWEGGSNQFVTDYSVQLKITGDPYFYTNGNTSQESIGAWTAGEILGLAFDVDAGTLKYYRNNVLKYTHTSIPTTKLWHPAFNCGTGANEYHYTNFGQRAFKYTAPSGYKCLCTQNLPDLFSGDEVNQPSKYFDTKLYTGTGSDMTIKGVGFNPDFIWIKERSDAQNHQLYDVVRGSANNYKRVELTTAASELKTSGVQTFNSDGFDIGDNPGLNESPQTYVSWLWDAGTSASGANDAGSIDIASGKQWVNTTAGFSITEYTGTSSYPETIGHGLNAKPEFIVIKRTDSTGSFAVQHKSLTADKVMWLNINDVAFDTGGAWNDTEPTSTLFTINNSSNVNANGGTFIAYCWTGIPGYSSFGKYNGNSSSTGPFIYTGFKPRWLLIKNVVDSGPEAWVLLDSKRDPLNPVRLELVTSSTAAEGNTDLVDFYTNGFKIRNSGKRVNDNNGGVYMVYAAFAEHPLKTARAH